MVSALQYGDIVQVRHHDGRSWDVTLGETAIDPRPVSCNGEPEAGSSWTVSAVVEADRWHH